MTTPTIQSIESILLRIPLRAPIRIAVGEIPYREYNIVRIHTSDGVEGVGYARGGSLVHSASIANIGPMALGRSLGDWNQSWADLYRETIQIGRRGAAIRSLSALDIAVWDAKCKAEGQPLWRLLGGDRGIVPCYASGGYYRGEAGVGDLESEVSAYLEQGFGAVKVKVGGDSLDADTIRVELVRSVVGPDATVMVDANTGYDDRPEAAAELAKVLARLDVEWFEEPFGPDRLRDLAALRGQDIVPIATGEQESTRWGFEALVDYGAADILQPDVTVVGGITEWLRVADLAVEHNMALAPHYFPEVHAQLAGAVPSTAWIEYFPRDTDIVNFDDVLTRPLRPVAGTIHLDTTPGVGLSLDDGAIDHFTIDRDIQSVKDS